MVASVDYRDGERVIYVHCDGEIPAKIERVCADGLHVILEVQGWLGTHWTPISKLKPAR